MFAELMGDVSGVKLGMTDQDSKEINAFKKTIPVIKSLLCHFHVKNAIDKKLDRKGQKGKAQHIFTPRERILLLSGMENCKSQRPANFC